MSKFTVVYYIQCTYVCIYYYNRFRPAYAIAVVGFAGALVYHIIYIYIIYGIYVRIFEGVVAVGGAGRSIAAPRTFYRLASGDGENPRGRSRLRARSAANASSAAAYCFYYYLRARRRRRDARQRHRGSDTHAVASNSCATFADGHATLVVVIFPLLCQLCTRSVRWTRCC